MKSLPVQVQALPGRLMPPDGDEKGGETFITETKNRLDSQGLSQIQASQEAATAAQTSYLGAQNSYLTQGVGASLLKSDMTGGGVVGKSPTPESRYKNIPTDNQKFKRFMDLIFDSRMPKQDQKEEILRYVQLLETNYNATIRDMKTTMERTARHAKKTNTTKVSEVNLKGDMENLFVECIEETRKTIMKRRLKSEILNSKKLDKIDQTSQEAKDFETSLLKLAELAKSRVKVNDFTPKDKTNMLELFVNNEKTLLRMYEILFPHRAGPNAGQGISSAMVQEAGGGTFGQSAIEAMKKSAGGSRRGASENSTNANQSMRVSAQNSVLLNQIGSFQGNNYPADFDYEMMRQGMI